MLSKEEENFEVQISSVEARGIIGLDNVKDGEEAKHAE
jgi:hypothetical protein